MKLTRKLRSLFFRNKVDAAMAEEMRHHLEMQAERNRSVGMSADEAHYVAQREFGNVASLQQRAREVRGWMWLGHVVRDVRLGIRSLAKTPGFTLIAIITIAFGVGANTATYSIFNEIVLRPLAFPQTEQLDRIFRVTEQNKEGAFSPADYLDFQSKMASYGEVAAYSPTSFSISESGRPAEMISTLRVSTNFFSTLGIRPQLGRDFRTEEVVHGNHRVLVISHRFWLNRFGGDTKIIGRTLRVDGEPHEIVGVMPAIFNDWRYLGWVDLYRPLGFSPQESAERSATSIRMVARRLSVLSKTEASAFVASFGERLAADFPAANARATWRILSLTDAVHGGTSIVTVSLLIVLSGFVLLIACSNLANFLLARTMARAREFAVRAALGASKFQLMLPLVIESLLLALAGGVGAILVATWATDWLTARSLSDDGGFVTFALDWSVLAWAFVASLVTAVAFGIAPALFAMRLNVNDTLKSGARGATAGRTHQRLGRVLIVSQFAIAMVLLSGAAVFVRGIHEVNNRRYGWESDNVVTGTISLPAASYPGAEEISAFHRLAIERLEALPGVSSASVSSALPFFGLSAPRRYVVQGRPLPEPGEEPTAEVNTVSSRYFESVGTRLLRGRGFNSSDSARSLKVFVINESMANKLFENQNPLGQRLAQAGGAGLEWGEVVGVVSDVQSVILDSKPVSYQLYQSITQEPAAYAEIAVRAPGVHAAALVSSIRATMAALNPDLPVTLLRPANTNIARANYQVAVLRDMLTAIALLGLGLASLGVYGVIARTVAQRTSEFGIRVALGARTQDITRHVLASGVKLAVIGSSIGVVGAVGITQLISAGYPSMPTNSLLVLIGVTLLLVTIAFVACWLPARRAAKVDPMIALRTE